MNRRKSELRAEMDALIVKCQVLRLRHEDDEAQKVLAKIEELLEKIERAEMPQVLAQGQDRRLR
jgi:hypothetical protein